MRAEKKYKKKGAKEGFSSPEKVAREEIMGTKK